MKTKFKDVAHFYRDITCYDSFNDENIILSPNMVFAYSHKDAFDQIKPILKPITDITEDDFREFSTSELLGINDRMAFDFYRYLWRSCSYEVDDDSIDCDDSERINDANENDCSNILMLHRPSMNITEGWLTDGETYSDCDLNTTARWIAFLCSRGYNVFGLDESEIITKQ